MSGGRNAMMAKLACGIALAVSLDGCVQATRHSNAVIFGTNTSLGIKVGTDATTTPSINVGYNRQEAVMMPLVANTGETRDDETGERLLVPCNVGNDVEVTDRNNLIGGSYPVHPCLLLATNRQATDSYSVLASFGANFGAAVRGQEAKAQGGLAQYFSTGMAAQLLAATGGASVVSAAAPNPGVGATTVPAALFGSDADRSRAVTLVSNYETFRANLVRTIGADSDATINARVIAFENKILPSRRIASRCMTVANCLIAFSDPSFSPYSSEHAINGASINGFLSTWTSN